jgi:hypothetical protein
LTHRKSVRKTYNGCAKTVTMSATVSAEFLERLLGEDVTLLEGWMALRRQPKGKTGHRFDNEV